MRIAIVGAGISGLVCAYLLAPLHDVTVFEREPRLGGHAHTVTIDHEGERRSVDVGFIVFNERTYPGFCALLKRLGVSARASAMSFSVRDDSDGFEYGGHSARGVIGGATNLLRPRWWRVVNGVRKFGREGKALLNEAGPGLTVSDLADSGRFSGEFLESYLLPLAGAIWSAPRTAILEFPAVFVLRFFENHGMLDLRERPRWLTVEGGSRRYIEAMLPAIGRGCRTSCRIDRVERRGGTVRLSGRDDGQERDIDEVFDHVILAVHSDQSLSMLSDASQAEREILGAMPYQANEAVLHADPSVLPRRRQCWAAWNYRVSANAARPVSVTYNLTILQGLRTRTPVCVTLNPLHELRSDRTFARHIFHHPLYTPEGEHARARWSEISGADRTHFCGAYWGNGFHEDGVTSAVKVCETLGVRGIHA